MGTVRYGTRRAGDEPAIPMFAHQADPRLGGPAIGARFDSCDAEVRVLYQTGDHRTHWNLAYGQRPVGTGGPIFSHQVERPRFGGVMLFSTRPKNVPVLAYFRVQSCLKPSLSARSSQCSPWSPTLTVSLGNNELTAY